MFVNRGINKSIGMIFSVKNVIVIRMIVCLNVLLTLFCKRSNKVVRILNLLKLIIRF